jgi:hypothetical protein
MVSIFPIKVEKKNTRASTISSLKYVNRSEKRIRGVIDTSLIHKTIRRSID